MGTSKKSRKIAIIVVSIILLLGVILTIIIITVGSNKKRIYNEYTKLISSYFSSIVDNTMEIGNFIDTKESYFDTERNISLENNTNELRQSILDSVTFEYTRDKKNNPVINNITNLYVSYISYEKVYEYIEQNRSEMYDQFIRIRGNTPKDRYIARDLVIKSIANAVQNVKSKNTINMQIEIVNLEGYYFISNSFDSQLNGVLFSNKELYKIYELCEEIIDIDRLIPQSILGAYNISKGASYEYGNGTFENMASLNRDVESIYMRKNSDEKIYVKVNKIYTGEEAIKIANDAHIDNRGLSLALSSQLLIVDYTISNLTDKKFKVKSKFALADSLGNLSSSTGKLYGIIESGTIEPYSEITLQWYTFNDNIGKKYLVWGSDFDKKFPYVWFDCLQKINIGE